MSEKCKVFFLGRFDCHFTHRQRVNKRLMVRDSETDRIWFEYVESSDSNNRKSRLCVYRKIDLKCGILEELKKHHAGEIERSSVEFTAELTRKRIQQHEFPSGLSSTADQRISQIVDSIKTSSETLISNFRWRLNLSGPGKHFGKTEYLWSTDENEWMTVPRTVFGEFTIERDINVEKLNAAIVKVALQTENVEPLPHLIFRDAWCQRNTDSKSSLMQGVSALEVATKHCIVRLIPEIEMLMLNVQSPPVVKLLNEILPDLIQKCGKQVPTLSLEIINTVKKMVHQRNHLVHRGKLTVDSHKVKEFLDVIFDILCYLDFVCGNDWAISLTSLEFKQWFSPKMPELDVTDPLE